MKIKKKHHKYYLLSFAVIAILTYSLLFTNVLNLKKGSQKYIEIVATPTQQQKVYKEREYVSKLGFKITVPEGYEIEEKSPVVRLMAEGIIVITKNLTDFNNLNDYIRKFDERRQLKVIEDIEKNINGFLFKERLLIYSTNNNPTKSYFFYKNNSVYTFSTSSPELYGDLEKIVQSFEYLEK